MIKQLRQLNKFYLDDNGKIFEMVKNDLYEVVSDSKCSECALKKNDKCYTDTLNYPTCSTLNGCYAETELWDYKNHCFWYPVEIVLKFKEKNKPITAVPKEITNNIVKPNHYKMTVNGQTIEVMDILKAILTPEELRGFNKGNIIKYILRERNKNGIADVKKCKQYAEFMLGDEK